MTADFDSIENVSRFQDPSTAKRRRQANFKKGYRRRSK